MHKIIEVDCDDCYRMKVTFENHLQLLIDFSKRKDTIRFALLSDLTFFKLATTDGQFIRWDDKIEISVRELLSMVDNDLR